MAMAEGECLDQMSKLDICAGSEAPDAEEAGLWEKLPRELQKKVLSYLPHQILVQVQCVCKAWRYVILDRDFISMYDEMHSSESPTLAMFYRETSFLPSGGITWLAYDYAQNSWKNKRMSILSPLLNFWRGARSQSGYSHQPELDRCLHQYCSVYSVGGLLMFQFWMMCVNDRVAWNPLTNKWKMLPPCNKIITIDSAFAFVHAFVSDESAKRYKILMAHNPSRRETGTSMVTGIYDSAYGVWTQSESALQYPLSEAPFRSWCHFKHRRRRW